jgi:D-3-phosphoglycerate dehydrogenase
MYIMTPTIKILVSDSLSDQGINHLKQFSNFSVVFDPTLAKDLPRLASELATADALIVRSATKVTADLMAKAAKLKIIGRAGIGVDNVDIKAATAKGIIVMNTPFGNSITTAEHAISLMLALARQIPEANASTHAGKWEKSKFMGVELTAKTLGLVGCGNIGSIVADRAIGLRMKVIAFDPFLTPERAVELGNTAIDYCPHCGICLFDHCRQCTARKSAFSRFCHACGTSAATSGPGASPHPPGA